MNFWYCDSGEQEGKREFWFCRISKNHCLGKVLCFFGGGLLDLAHGFHILCRVIFLDGCFLC